MLFFQFSKGVDSGGSFTGCMGGRQNLWQPLQQAYLLIHPKTMPQNISGTHEWLKIGVTKIPRELDNFVAPA